MMLKTPNKGYILTIEATWNVILSMTYIPSNILGYVTELVRSILFFYKQIKKEIIHAVKSVKTESEENEKCFILDRFPSQMV